MKIEWDELSGLAYEVDSYFEDCPKRDVVLAMGGYDYVGFVEGTTCQICSGTGIHKQIWRRTRRKLSKQELKAAQRMVRKNHY